MRVVSSANLSSFTESWLGVQCEEVQWEEVQCEEVQWLEVQWEEVQCEEVQWLEVQWEEVQWVEVQWEEVQWLEVQWEEVQRVEVQWVEVQWEEVQWLEVQWLEVQWLEVQWEEVQWLEIMRLMCSSWIIRRHRPAPGASAATVSSRAQLGARLLGGRGAISPFGGTQMEQEVCVPMDRLRHTLHECPCLQLLP
uniref:Uncharacterized protein n=1 Tax=Knipowitschia caucasica TaxID=637954 RepID=A0AAV2MMF5_KNICA